MQAIQAIVDYLDKNGLEALHSSTQIIIAPGYTYKIVKMLVTNFHHVFHQMEEQYAEVKCFYLDIFATKNLEQMVQLMASEIIGKLDTVSQSALRKVQEFFSSIDRWFVDRGK